MGFFSDWNRTQSLVAEHLCCSYFCQRSPHSVIIMIEAYTIVYSTIQNVDTHGLIPFAVSFVPTEICRLYCCDTAAHTSAHSVCSVYALAIYYCHFFMSSIMHKKYCQTKYRTHDMNDIGLWMCARSGALMFYHIIIELRPCPSQICHFFFLVKHLI